MPDLWKERKYIDLWSVNHLIGGGLLACVFFLLNFGFWYGVLISFVLMLLWEIYEFFGPIEEHPTNQVIDMVIAILGFVVTYIILLDLAIINRLIFLIVIFDVFVILEVLGYLSYRKRNKN